MENIDVGVIAALARLSFTEEEAEKIRFHMKRLTELCSALDDIDSDDDGNIPSFGELREDIPVPFSDSNKIISAAPSANGAYITVPRVVSVGEGQ